MLTPATPCPAPHLQDDRDEAMTMKCESMFDCDGDRRDFAKKQYEDWLAAGGTPKRMRDGKKSGPRSF